MKTSRCLLTLLASTFIAAQLAFACYGNLFIKSMKSKELVAELEQLALRDDPLDAPSSQAVIDELRARGRDSLDAMLARRKNFAVTSSPVKGTSEKNARQASRRFDQLWDQVAGQLFATHSKLLSGTRRLTTPRRKPPSVANQSSACGCSDD